MDSAIRRQTIADLLHRTAQRFPHKSGLLCLPKNPSGKLLKRELRAKFA